MFETQIFRRGHSHMSGWWSRSGSNRRPQACKARALPTELRPQKSVQSGLPSRSCGRKPVFAPTGSDAAAFAALQRRLVGPGRVERPTSRLSGVRSNHLSYEPETRGYGFRITSPRQSRSSGRNSHAPSRGSDWMSTEKGRETKTAVLSPYV